MAKSSKANRAWRLEALIAVLVLVVVGVLIAMLVRNGSSADDDSSLPQNTPQQDTSQQEQIADMVEQREADDPLARGSVDAPVVMVAFEDFRCPFCAKFSTETAPKLIDRYVDKGVLRIEWRDYPIFGEESKRAARAGRAAAKQDKFWEFHDVVFSHAPDRGHPDLPMDKLVSYAKEAGIDIDQFKSDMDDQSVEEAVEADASLATQLGIQSTPAFIINGQAIIGAQPLDTFVEAIEQAKEQAE